MTRMCCLLAASLLLGAGPQAVTAQTVTVAEARALAIAGRPADAIALLERLLSTEPANHEARTALGTILSWEGRYDDARRELEVVLRANPADDDALTALLNVELWSAHPEQAHRLALRGLLRRPDDTGYLLAHARTLVALKRPAEAAEVLDRLLALDPRHELALALHRTLARDRRLWQARAGGSYDAFDDRDAQREAHISLSRTTPWGPVLIRGARADRYGLQDHQVELEIYPRLGERTYAYLAGAFSPDAGLYPRYRYATDVYQNFGRGFEGSAGYRRLSFGDGVNIYVGALSKYHGSWLFTGRAFLTPGTAGTAKTMQGAARRYFGAQGGYVALRYSRGAWRDGRITVDDFEVLNSDAVTVEAVFMPGARFEVSLSGWYGREDRVDGRQQNRYSISSGLGFRF